MSTSWRPTCDRTCRPSEARRRGARGSPVPLPGGHLAARRRRPARAHARRGHQLAGGHPAPRGGRRAGGVRPLLELVPQDLLPDPGRPRGRDRPEGADEASDQRQLLRHPAEGPHAKFPQPMLGPGSRGRSSWAPTTRADARGLGTAGRALRPRVDGAAPIVAISEGFADTVTTTGSGTGGRCWRRVRCRSCCRTTNSRPTGRRCSSEWTPWFWRGSATSSRSDTAGRIRIAAKVTPARSSIEIELSYARLAVEAGVPLLGDMPRVPDPERRVRRHALRRSRRVPRRRGRSPRGEMGRVAGARGGHPGRTRASRPPDASDRDRTRIDAGHASRGTRRGRQLPPPGRAGSGGGVRPVAWAPHGVVEAIEMPAAAAFVLGVQWELHEEWRADESMFGIWRAFVGAAARRSEDRDVVEASR